MTDEEVNGMSLQEYEIYEEKRMQDNAWYVAKVIKDRIHDAPVLSEYITSIVSDKPGDLFFFNQEFLHKYSKKNSDSAKVSVPGSNYFKKNLTFWDIHYKRGELFMEYQKGSCLGVSGELCWYCKWNTLDVFSIPLVDGKGTNREADDWQPRVQVTKAFNEGLVSLDNREGISELCKELACEEKHIAATLEHIKDIEIRKEKRARERHETRTA